MYSINCAFTELRGLTIAISEHNRVVLYGITTEFLNIDSRTAIYIDLVAQRVRNWPFKDRGKHWEA